MDLTARTSGLFSKHLTVAAWPENLRIPPRSLQCDSTFCLDKSVMRPKAAGRVFALEPWLHYLNFRFHDNINRIRIVNIA